MVNRRVDSADRVLLPRGVGGLLADGEARGSTGHAFVGRTPRQGARDTGIRHGAYRFFDASREVAFLHGMIQQAAENEIPRELAWLSGYDKAFTQLDAEFDLPRKDLSALIRMAQSSQGRLSAKRRKQYFHLPVDVLDRVEEVVCESFGLIARDGAEEG